MSECMKKKNKRKMNEDVRFEELLAVVYHTAENIRVECLIKRENLLDYLIEKRKQENKRNMLFYVFQYNRDGKQIEKSTELIMQ